MARIVERVDIGVDAQADRVARVGRAKDRQHQIGTVRYPPRHTGSVRNRPACARARRSWRRRRAPAIPSGRVDDEAARGGHGVVESPLQHVVDEDDRLLQIVERTAQASRNVVGHDRDIDFGDRPQQELIERHVDVEDLAVERFERVVGLLECGPRRRVGRRRGAARKNGRGNQNGDRNGTYRRHRERRASVSRKSRKLSVYPMRSGHRRPAYRRQSGLRTQRQISIR